MNILILLAVLSVLSSSQGPIDVKNSVAGKTLIISDNGLKISLINGVKVTFSQNQISFTGCNTNIASYSLTRSGEFSIKNPWVTTTQRFCIINYDFHIRNLFSNSTEASWKNNKLLFTKGLTINIISEPINLLKSRKLIIQSTFKNKSTLVGTSVEFGQEIIVFKGSKEHQSIYKVGQNNYFKLTEPWQTFLILCHISADDRQIKELFEISTRFQVKTGGKVQFFDKENNSIMQLGPKTGSQAIETIITPLRRFLKNKRQWPQLLGKPGQIAKNTIIYEDPTIEAQVLPEGSKVIMNFCEDRVRVFVNKNGIVASTPKRG